MADVGQRVVIDVCATGSSGTLLDQSAAFFSRRTSGQLLSRITNDVTQVQLAVSETVAGSAARVAVARRVRRAISSTSTGGWRSSCMTAAPLVVYPLVRLGQRVRRTTRRGQEQLEHLTHLATEGLTGHRIVKAFGAEGREAARFGEASHELYRTNMKITSAVVGAAAADGVHRRPGGGRRALVRDAAASARALMTPGDFTSFLAAAFMMYGPIKKLSRVNASLQQTIAASERIFEMLDTHTEVHEKPGAPALAPAPDGGRVPRRRLRLRGRPDAVRPAPRVVHGAGRPGRRPSSA